MRLRKKKKPTAEEYMDTVHAAMMEQCLENAKRRKVDYID